MNQPARTAVPATMPMPPRITAPMMRMKRIRTVAMDLEILRRHEEREFHTHEVEKMRM